MTPEGRKSEPQQVGDDLGVVREAHAEKTQGGDVEEA
jgi:hypothetical protein